MPAGIHTGETQSYLLDEDVTEANVFVCQGAAAGSVKLPAAEADKGKVVGVVLTTGRAGQTVLVAKTGTILVVADEVITQGSYITCKISTAKGRAIGLAVPSAPAAATGPSAAEVNAVTTYATSILTFGKTCLGPAKDEGSAAQGDLIGISLGKF
jgi:hypothetical protein